MNRKEAVQRCYQIPGMCWPAELGALFDLFSGSQSHCEVGSFCGRSLFASAMALAEGANLYVVESFAGCAGEAGSMPTPSPSWIEGVLNLTIAAIRENRPDLSILLIPKPSLDAMRFVPPVQSVYIDANHHYAECCCDIQGWRANLLPGGILAGHDYWPAERGVMEAVQSCVESFRVIEGTRIWVAS